MKYMNILEINKFFYLKRGAERHFLDVIDVLEKNGNDVAVFSMQHSKNISSKWEKFFVSYVGYNTEDSGVWQKLVGIGRIFWSFEARRNIRKLLEEFNPDVVHLHNIYHQISPSILAPLKRSGAKIVMTVHDYNPISPDKDRYYENVGRNYWKFLFMRKYSFLKRLLLVLKKYFEDIFGFYKNNIDAYIVPSEYVKNILVQGGIESEKIVVIPHFIDMPVLENRDWKYSFGKKSYALYFGDVSRNKGVDQLVRIFQELQIPIVIAGTLSDDYVFPESPFVHFVGQQTKQELQALIANASCVVSGSSLPETFGLIVTEANILGIPFFGLESGAFREIVVDFKNGVLAKDYTGLQRNISMFFDGKVRFSSEEIVRMTLERYGKDTYYNQFSEILRII